MNYLEVLLSNCFKSVINRAMPTFDRKMPWFSHGWGLAGEIYITKVALPESTGDLVDCTVDPANVWGFAKSGLLLVSLVI